MQAQEDPFLDNDFLELVVPRVQRTVCAIGIGGGENRLMGTGFLVGPDLVMTNFHVIKDCVRKISNNGEEDKYDETIKGDQIFCFFDYLAAPPPRVPPDATRPHSSVVVKGVQEKWLIRARELLDGDGQYPFPTQAEKKFDYAIIRLERDIGNAPSGRTGGAPRGWLSIQTGVNYLAGTRIIVLQHPQGSHQVFDIGEYHGYDPSETRIWYTVNTDFGSSGGAAIDKEGRLYALHNAAVKDPTRAKVNQGVRIDKILDDLSLPPVWAQTPPPVDGDPTYWSLSDTVDKPRPIIGRTLFRQTVLKMKGPACDSVLAVVGKKGTGRRFSVDLLRRLVGANTPVFRFTPTHLQTLSPAQFIKYLKSGLALPDIDRPLPEPEPTEPRSRWIGVHLPVWLAETIKKGRESNPSRFPCWVVLDAVVEDGEPVLWADGLTDLISSLTGGNDPGQAKADLSALRWIMLGASPDIFPPTGLSRIVDDLDQTPNIDYADDFANCVSLAWRSLSARSSMDLMLLRQFGKQAVKRATNAQILRASLAEDVRDLVLSGLAEGVR